MGSGNTDLVQKSKSLWPGKNSFGNVGLQKSILRTPQALGLKALRKEIPNPLGLFPQDNSELCHS